MTKLIALPKDEAYSITPKLWLALGLMAYNHQLLTLRPLEILTPAQVEAAFPSDHREAVERGLATIVCVDHMSADQRSAFVQIARELLATIGVDVYDNTRKVANDASPRYVTIIENGEGEPLHMPNNNAGRTPNPSADRGRGRSRQQASSPQQSFY
jgi:hypothetical protein